MKSVANANEIAKVHGESATGIPDATVTEYVMRHTPFTCWEHLMGFFAIGDPKVTDPADPTHDVVETDRTTPMAPVVSIA